MDAAPLDWRPDSVFVQAGASSRDARVGGAGLRWDLPWPHPAAGWRGTLQVSLARWSAAVSPGDAPLAGREHVLQLVVLPAVRWQTDAGGSGSFVEAGLGLSLHDRPYRVERVRQGSRLNFQEELAWGRHLGGGHAVSLRLAHMSNAGLRKPNPGETWWSLRWEAAF